MTLSEEVRDEAERLTRLARESTDDAEEAAYRERREELLAEHGYVARVRSDDTGDVLVCHPASWLDDDGTVDLDAVEDVSRAVELPLSGTGDGDWAAVDAHNRAVVERVVERYDEVHGRTARALADFASNHYAKRIGRLTPAEREEFLGEYLPRNAWPTAEQRDRAPESVELALDAADALEEGT